MPRFSGWALGLWSMRSICSQVDVVILRCWKTVGPRVFWNRMRFGQLVNSCLEGGLV